MKQLVGKIIEVYIPEDKTESDIMYNTRIGFKVQTAEGLKIIEMEQDKDNVKLYKEDTILITEQDISGKHFIDIERLEDE